MSTYDHKRQIFYTNLLLLGYDQSFAQTHGIHKVAFNVDMFKLPNKAGFEVVIYFLFHRLDPQRSAAEFRSCWPVRDKKAEQTFRKVCNGWLCQIAQDEPDAHLPKIVPSIFQSPGGERFCNLLLAFSTYVLSTIIKAENGVSAVDMLLRPILTPQNIEYAAAMVKGTHCMVINGRKRFFDSIHNRETLHKTWQSSAKDMLTEYRRLSKKIRETEANVKAILSNHGDRGISSPARSDRNRKSLTSASKHGRIFDVNIQSVRREEKIQKVRDLWSSVEDFLASSDTQQEVVSSILSGVVHKYILRASDLDIRIPEMLLRECERELLKRDISNTYKAGKLDLVSILNLWNLSMHLYLERFEECDVIDLSKQLEDLQPKVNALNQQLDSSRTLANSLRTQLISELKESISQMKDKLAQMGGYGGHGSPGSSKPSGSQLEMSLQPNSPPLTFDPSYASAADVEASKMTFTPDMLPQESTPDAVGRILKSVSQGVKPRRLVDAGKENRTPAAGKGSNQSGALSPLTQGHVRRARKGEYPFNCSNSSFSSRSPLTPQRGQQNSVEVSRVGRKQLTKVISAGDSIFSPTETGSIKQLGVSPDIHESAIPTTPTANVTTPSANLTTPAANLTTPPHSFSWKKETVDKTPPFTPTNQSKLKLNNPADREEALNRLYSQVEKLPPVAASPSDVLAARIAQSIIGDGDTYLPEDANVLDELGVSGFLKRDKIARTPETTGYSSQISSVTSKVVRHAGGETNNKELSFTGALSDDTEDGIITVKGQTLNISSSSSASSPPPNALQLPQVTAENSPVSPSNAGGVRSRPSSSRSTTELYKEKSLIDYICKTPSAGRRIVNSVLDEEPLFIEDSPVGTTPRHDDLYALMPQDTFGSSLHNSSGFTPSLPPRTNSTVRQQAGPMSSTNCSDEAASKPNSLTLEELGLKFAALKGRQLLTE